MGAISVSRDPILQAATIWSQIDRPYQLERWRRLRRRTHVTLWLQPRHVLMDKLKGFNEARMHPSQAESL
jgi:hypothetical protein